LDARRRGRIERDAQRGGDSPFPRDLFFGRHGQDAEFAGLDRAFLGSAVADIDRHDLAGGSAGFSVPHGRRPVLDAEGVAPGGGAVQGLFAWRGAPWGCRGGVPGRWHAQTIVRRSGRSRAWPKRRIVPNADSSILQKPGGATADGISSPEVRNTRILRTPPPT